jgi:hypothetical protein
VRFRCQLAYVRLNLCAFWKRMLKVGPNFHRYSFNNHLMIFLL